MATYRCKRCNFLYKDSTQETRFEEIDSNQFRCPRCKCSKAMFELIEDS
ncbi:MAG: rubredoxin [Candidatus Thorarchaeota archaeon]